MSDRSTQAREMLKPPVALGCVAAVATVVLVVLAFVFFVVFLNSGTSSSNVTLNAADSYGQGTVTYVGQQNLYVVRLPSGSFIILADLDAENRASTTRKCRVQPVSTSNPQFAEMISKYGPRMSPQAASTTFLFQEACNGAVYDIAGERLDKDGPNLDRYSWNINGDGKLVVDTRSRTCTSREGATLAAPVACVQ